MPLGRREVPRVERPYVYGARRSSRRNATTPRPDRSPTANVSCQNLSWSGPVTSTTDRVTPGVVGRYCSAAARNAWAEALAIVENLHHLPAALEVRAKLRDLGAFTPESTRPRFCRPVRRRPCLASAHAAA